MIALLLDAALAAEPLPKGIELPIRVATALSVSEVSGVDEAASTFDGTVDVVLRWHDPGVAFDAKAAGTDRKIFTGQDADTTLGDIWDPAVDVANLAGEPANREASLRLHANGDVEYIQRIRGSFETPIDLARFPFDHQHLQVELDAPRYNSRQVTLVHTQADAELSGVSPRVELPEWVVGDRVRFEGDEVRGLDGMTHSEITGGIDITRVTRSFVASLFAPLAVILLLPCLCIWVRTDIHERINWVITAVFSLIALNFSVGIEYPALGVDSTFMRLFWYGYVAQGVALALIMLLFNEGRLAAWLGEDLIEESLSVLGWALPLLIALAFGDVMFALAT